MRRDGAVDAMSGMPGAPKLNVLYEDNHLLVVEKPVNVPVQADVSGDDDLLSMCRRYIRVAYGKPGEAFVALVHRLDRPVGGVMVFARTSKAAARLTAQFKSHAAGKRYVAVVEGCPPASLRLTDWLRKDEATLSSAVVPEGTDGARFAELRFSCIGRANGRALLDISLRTGRPHQIRVQLAHAGFPIEGDQRYNPAARPGTQIRLWAYALSIKHPTLGEDMTFFSLPRDPDPRPGAGFCAFPAQLALLPAFSACRGVFLDDELLVVDKNAGVEVENELCIALESLVGELFPVHRLDANTEGLVAFARTAAMRDRLLQAFRSHDGVRKTYRAVLAGVPSPRAGTLEHFLVKDADAAQVRVVPAGTPGAQRATLAYRVLEARDGLSLVEIELFTGRTHQIRVQTAAIGCPVLGDDRYGDREANRRFHCRRQLLLAARLSLFDRTFESERTLSIPARD